MLNPVITRFAPSPTGHLHIGGARTALFCWAFARRARLAGDDGRFLLRIEDTDQARSSEDAARGILEDLAWLGIAWDDGPEFPSDSAPPGGTARRAVYGGDPRNIGPFHQSLRLDLYNQHLDQLLEAGLAYPAFDTPEELAAMRKAAEAEKRSFIYRRCADADHAADLARMTSQPHVIRLAMPREAITVDDRVLGSVTFPYEELDDFVIRKADGFPTYHFAVVVDDALMGVTHVLRGQEHLNNTPRHIALQRALGFATPVYAHMPLIFNVDSTKMSKRDKDKAAKKACRDSKIETVAGLIERLPRAGWNQASTVLDSLTDADLQTWLTDKQRQLSREQVGAVACALSLHLPEIDVEDFREAGYLPGVLCNFLALLGWNPGMKNEDGTDLERFDNAFLAEHFSLERIGKSNSKFDRDKLLAFNAHTIQHGMTDDEFARDWLAWADRFDDSLADWARADERRWALAAAAARPRTRILREARDAVAFALTADDAIAFEPKSVDKHLLANDRAGLTSLAGLRAVLAAIEAWSPESIDGAIGAHAEGSGLGMGKVAQPLRVALTGGAVSPPLGLTLSILGRASAQRRIDRCLESAQG